MIRLVARMFTAGSLMLAIVAGIAKAQQAPLVYYQSVKVDGLSISYREAGPPNAPTLLLLHGFPSSSRMYEPLLTRLGGQFHLIAPDYPGFGHSDAPNAEAFAYTFDHIAEVIGHFTETVGATRYILYLEDYGGPVGFRLALGHPERVQGLIIQNAVARRRFGAFLGSTPSILARSRGPSGRFSEGFPLSRDHAKAAHRLKSERYQL